MNKKYEIKYETLFETSTLTPYDLQYMVKYYETIVLTFKTNLLIN